MLQVVCSYGHTDVKASSDLCSQVSGASCAAATRKAAPDCLTVEGGETGLGTQESLNMIKVGQPVYSKPQHAAVAWGDEQQKPGAPLRCIETGSLPTGKDELQISEKPTHSPSLDVHNVFSVYTYAIVLVLCAGVATIFLLIFYRNSSTLFK